MNNIIITQVNLNTIINKFRRQLGIFLLMFEGLIVESGGDSCFERITIKNRR
jgi:hypothetical protein